MNKIIYKVVLFLITIISIISFSSCSLYYDIDSLDEYIIGYSHKSAFIGSVSYDLDTTEIHLPSVYKGANVEELGGYYGRGVPTPFYFSYKGVAYGYYTNVDEIGKNDVIIQTNIDVYLPKYLKTCTYVKQYVGGMHENDHDIIYIARCNYYIDSGNDYFYTQNGILYNKKDNTTVDGLIYQDNKNE